MERPHSFIHSGSEPAMVVPPPSFNSLQMPNVFVIPPEEEHAETPPFLYFDASKAVSMSTTPDLESLNIALDVHQQITNTAPVFQRTNVSEETIVMPRKGSGMPFVSPREWQTLVKRETATDEDVVEVIKVRKHEGVSETGQNKDSNIVRSKTFRARATQAFRSIKNVGKSNRKSSVQDMWSPTENDEDVNLKQSLEEASSTRRNLSKRRSRPLSQIFQFGRDEPPHTLPSESKSPSPPQSPQTSPSPAIPPSRPLSVTSNYSSLTSSELVDYPQQTPPTLPKRAKRSNSFRKRLSLLELPRLFISSSVSTTSSTITTSSSTSQASSPSPPTPSNEIPESEAAPPEVSACPPTIQQSSHNWLLPDLYNPKAEEDEEVDYGELQLSSLSMVREEDSYVDDLSVEMRLDSLHFDSLAFDANDFTMASLRDGHRKTSEIIVL